MAQEENFNKWKPSVLYWLMGSALLLGQVFWKKNLMQKLMGAQLQLPAHAWRTLNWAWIGFFTAMGALNLWVAYRFDTDTWVNFKMYGGLGLMLLFVLGQAVYMSRYLQTPPTEQPPKP